MKKSTGKSHKVVIGVFFCACLIIPLALLGQQKEMPITTASAEAKKLFLEGRDKYELIEFAASAQYFDRAIEQDPNFVLAYVYRFRTGTGGAKVAHEYLAKAVHLVDKVSPGEKYLVLYYKARVDREGTKQKEYLDKLMELFPSDKRVQYLMGQYFDFIERDLPTALKYYQRVTELDRTYAPVYNTIGYCQMNLQNFQEAEKAFVEQIKLVPDRPNPYDSYADLLMRMGRYDESIAQFKKALDKDASFTGALAGIGDDYLFKGDYKTAREYYEKRFDKDSDLDAKFSALDKTASSFAQEGNMSAALNLYERYRTLAKEHNRTSNIVLSYANEGFILTESGNAAEGLRRYQKAAEVVNASDTPEAVKKDFGMLSRFWECYALLANNDTETALAKMKELSPMIEKRRIPDDSRWMNFLNGMVESKQGNYAKALEHYSSSWPDIPFIKYYVAVAYEKMGEKEKAMKLYKEIENWKQNDLGLALVKQHIKKGAAK